MNTQLVGETAGLAWKHLQTKGKMTIRQLEKGIDAPPDVVHMAVGWLAREGKLDLALEKRSLHLWLAESA